ncbi:hypothetical protein L7F22_002624 [Adiantum nelumboides]|nr:hypothetical protein [Adiantum nelumboides]
MGPLPRTANGKLYILVAIDYMTRLGAPVEIVSDNGPGFRKGVEVACMEFSDLKSILAFLKQEKKMSDVRQSNLHVRDALDRSTLGELDCCMDDYVSSYLIKDASPYSNDETDYNQPMYSAFNEDISSEENALAVSCEIECCTKDFVEKLSKNLMQNESVNAFEADEDKKSLVIALGNQASGQRCGHESLLGVPRDDVREQQPLVSQTGSKSDARAELPISDNFSNDDSPFDQNVQSVGRDQETWGKWLANKLNAAKDTVSTGLLGLERRADDDSPSMVTTTPGHNDSETPLAIAVGNESRNRRDNDNLEKNDNITGLAVATTSSLGVDEDEEYYDSNNADHGQFQEGFARGTREAEEEVLNGTLMDSATGKLQRLTDVVANKFGLSGNSHPKPFEADNVEEPNTGQLLTSEEDESQRQPAIPLENEQVSTKGSQQQFGGVFQGLRNMLAMEPSYGVQEKPPIQKEQSVDDKRGEHAAAVKESYRGSDEGQSIPSQQQSGSTVQDLRNVIDSKLGDGESMQKRLWTCFC